jgi:hypothetical protein
LAAAAVVEAVVATAVVAAVVANRAGRSRASRGSYKVQVPSGASSGHRALLGLGKVLNLSLVTCNFVL